MLLCKCSKCGLCGAFADMNQLFMQFMSEVWELYAFKMFLNKSLMLIKAAFMCSKTEQKC